MIREDVRLDSLRTTMEVLMSGYAVANLDEIDELNDGRCPYRPVRHHLGITAFGINAWTARDTGERIINEHDESDDVQEELGALGANQLRGRLTMASLVVRARISARTSRRPFVFGPVAKEQ
jgi:hypothetical protein